MNIYQHIKELKEKNQGKSFAVLAERCETSEENPHRIKIAQPLKPEETCVVIIPGMHEKENDQYLRLYNSILKKVHDFVNKTPEFTENQVRVCVTVRSLGKFHDYEKASDGLYYEKMWPNAYQNMKERTPQDYREETFNPQYINDIFNSVILPRISQKEGSERISLEQAKKNIRRLNLLLHCNGGYVTMQLEKILNKKMTELQYSKDEQKQIKSQLLVLAYNPNCPKVYSEFNFISIESALDSHNKYQNYIREYLLMKPHNFGICYIGKKWGKSLICSRVNNKKKALKQINDIDLYKERELAYKLGYIGEHEFMGFEPAPNMSSSAKKLQQFANNILYNAIHNSLKQNEDNFVPLPKIQNLVSKNFQQKCDFAKAAITGYLIEQKTLFSDLKKIDQYANWRRSIPKVTLD